MIPTPESRITYIPPGFLIQHLDSRSTSGTRVSLIGNYNDVMGECDHCRVDLSSSDVLAHKRIWLDTEALS